MGDKVLSQSQIDALMSKNAQVDEPDVSPEMEALLTKGRTGEEGGGSFVAPKKANKLEAIDKSVPAAATPVAPPPSSIDYSENTAAKKIEIANSEAARRSGKPSVSRESAATPEVDAADGSRGVKSFGKSNAASPSGGAGARSSSDMDAIAGSLQAALGRVAMLEQALTGNTQASSQQLDQAMARVSSLEQMVAGNANLASHNINQSMGRVVNLEQAVTEISNRMQVLSRDMQRAFSVFENLNAQMSKIKRALEGTMGYDMRENFECESCGSHGYVVGLVKCTECDQEDWWGWWPEED